MSNTSHNILAHSLGNMLVSAAKQDYGLQYAKYFMLNAAVPAEAYDLSIAIRVPQLVHPDWADYPTNSWVSSWHALFMNDLEEDGTIITNAVFARTASAMFDPSATQDAQFETLAKYIPAVSSASGGSL